MTEGKLLERIKREYGDSGGRSKLARTAGVSRSYITDIFEGRRPIAKSIADALGFERVVVFRKKAQAAK